MTQTVEQIVKGLTEAQRWSLAKGSDITIASSTTPACRCALQRKGLVVDRQYSERLTPLGISVRTYLQEHQHEG